MTIFVLSTLGPDSIWNPTRTGRQSADAFGRQHSDWILRILSIAAATIMLFARDVLNFSILQFMTITLLVDVMAAAGWSKRHDIRALMSAVV